jgi:hypothetical protein
MEDHKFKVGDKVILTGDSWESSKNSVGDVGFITESNISCSKVSKTNNLSESGNWHPNKDFKLYTEEKYFTIGELKLNNGDVVEHSIGVKYVKDAWGLRCKKHDVYLNKEYYAGVMSSHVKDFKVISRATVKKEEKTMTDTSKFVETVTVTNSFVKEAIDFLTEGHALISIKPNSTNSCIELVIGAEFKERSCPFFTKDNLGKLIEELKAVHSVMV